MGLDTSHLKLTVKQHLERSLFILKDPRQFFTTLFSGEITLKEQVIPYFVLFSLIEISSRTLLAVVTHETMLFALHASIVECIALGLTIAALSMLLPKIEQWTLLKGSVEKYAALLIYGSTAGYYATVVTPLVPILGMLGIFALYTIIIGCKALTPSPTTHSIKSCVSIILAVLLCGILARVVTSPIAPSLRSVLMNSTLSDDERLQESIRKIFEQEQQRLGK